MTRDPIQATTNFIIYLINNYRFNTKDIYEQRTIQNIDICVDAIIKCISRAKEINMVSKIITYYCVIKEIIILNCIRLQYPLFKYDWVNVHDKKSMCKNDKIGYILVNMSILRGDR